MPVQIAAIAVVGVGRKALLSRVDGQPLLRKLSIGLCGIVLRSVRRCFLLRSGAETLDHLPLHSALALVFGGCLSDLVVKPILLQIVDISLPVHRLQFGGIGFPLVLDLAVFCPVGINDVVGNAPHFVGCHDRFPFLIQVR